MNSINTTAILFLAHLCTSASGPKVDELSKLKIDLLVSRSSISGEVLEVRKVRSNEPWGTHAIRVRSKDSESTILAWIGEEPFDSESIRVGAVGTFPTQQVGEMADGLAIWNGRIAFHPEIVLSKEESTKLLREAETQARGVLSGFQPCASEHAEILNLISSKKSQEGIDLLFKETPASSRLLQCLIAQVDSKRHIDSVSFRPPWNSWEGVYHHGFGSLGELLAYILPHLTEESIYPPNPPSSPEELESLKLAWALWYLGTATESQR